MTTADSFTAPNSAGEWPADSLERVDRCPVCDSPHAECVYEGLNDASYFTAKGSWRMVACKFCGSYYLDPRPDEQSIGDAYGTYYTHDDAAEIAGAAGAKTEAALRGRGLKALLREMLHAHVRNRFGIGLCGSPLERRVQQIAFLPFRRQLARDYRHLPGADTDRDLRLLDVGCGNGKFLAKARKVGWHVEGVDIDAKAVAAASSRQLDARIGTLKLYDGQEGLFDVVTASHVIEHVHHPSQFLDDCYRLLKPGGVLWLETPNIASEGHRIFGRDWRGLEVPRHLVLFNSGSLQRIIAQAGFAKIAFLKSYNPGKGMHRASLAMREGRRQDDLPDLDAGRALTYWWSRVHNLIDPKSSEFLTLQAIKPATPPV